MFRTLLSLTLASSLVTAGRSRAGDDPVAARLAAAKDGFKKESEKLGAELLAGLDAAEDAARAAGDRPLVEKLKAERAAFVEAGKAPTIAAGVTYARAMQAARSKLEAAYKQAMVEYLKVKKDDELAVVEQEMKAFLAAKAGAKPQPKEAREAYPVGTLLAGQLKWDRDPGNHSYLLVITERNGKAFRGIARLDYGSSGDAKRKDFYDVEGEITATGLKYKGDLAGLGEVEGKWANDALRITASADNGGTLAGELRFKKK